MEKISKKLVVVSVLIAVIITGIGVAFGYFVWNSTTNTDISFTVSGAIVELNDGSDITGANLMPVASYTSGGSNVVKKDIKIKLKDTTTDTVTVDFKLNINSIDSGLNHSSFKYNLVNASGTSVKSGNFATSKKGDSISLLTLSNSDGSLTTSTTSYTLYIYIDGSSGDNPSSMQNQSFDFSLDVTGSNSSMEKLTNNAVRFVQNLDDGTTGDSGSGVYKVTHDAIAASNSATGSEIPAVTDYRYYGASPNNYICLDNSAGTCEDRHLYRIIGSIYEELSGKNLLKVIKATPLTDGTTSSFSWDYTSSGDYSNIWSITTSGTRSGSTSMQLLNGIWLTRGSGSYYNGSTTATTVNFTNYGPSDKAQSLINTISRYYLGGYDTDEIKTSDVYLKERGTTSVSDYVKYWDGTIALMYPSDFGYASGSKCTNEVNIDMYDGGCDDKNWVHSLLREWTVISVSSPEEGANYVKAFNDDGSLHGNGANDTYSIRPTFYLSSTVSISSGSGTETDPYLAS